MSVAMKIEIKNCDIYQVIFGKYVEYNLNDSNDEENAIKMIKMWYKMKQDETLIKSTDKKLEFCMNFVKLELNNKKCQKLYETEIFLMLNSKIFTKNDVLQFIENYLIKLIQINSTLFDIIFVIQIFFVFLKVKYLHFLQKYLIFLIFNAFRSKNSSSYESVSIDCLNRDFDKFSKLILDSNFDHSYNDILQFRLYLIHFYFLFSTFQINDSDRYLSKNVIFYITFFYFLRFLIHLFFTILFNFYLNYIVFLTQF